MDDADTDKPVLAYFAEASEEDSSALRKYE